MNKICLAVLAGAALTAAAAITPAQAQGGCGPYRHRDWAGFCRPGGQWGYPPVYGFGGGYGWHRPWGWHHGWGGGWGWRHRFYG